MAHVMAIIDMSKIQVLAVHSYNVLSATPVIDYRIIRMGTKTFPQAELKSVQALQTFANALLPNDVVIPLLTD